MIQKVMNDALIKIEQANQKEPITPEWWRSSNLGSCMRGRLLGRLFHRVVSPNFDSRTLGVFRMGHITEESVIQLLRQSDDWIIFTQGEMYSEKYNLKGHFDAVLINTNTGKTFLFENKSKNSKAFTFMTGGASLHYKMQWHSYGWMINNSGFKVYSDLNALDILIRDLEKYLELNFFGDIKTSLENALLIAKAEKRALQYVFANKLAEVNSTVDTCEIQVNIKITDGCIMYVSKDDYRIAEFPLNVNDKDLEQAWQFEMDTLNKCWNEQTAPPENEPGAWQTKYCQFCQAGVCQKLTDDGVKSLFELAKDDVASRQFFATVAKLAEQNKSKK